MSSIQALRTSRRYMWLTWSGTAVATGLALTAKDPAVTYGVLSVVALGHFFLYLFKCHVEARVPDARYRVCTGYLVRRKVGCSTADGPPSWTAYLWFNVPELGPPDFDAGFESEVHKLKWLAHNPTDLGERWHYRTFQTKREALAWIRPYRLGGQYPVRQHPHLTREVVLVLDLPPLNVALYQVGLGFIYLSVLVALFAKWGGWPGW